MIIGCSYRYIFLLWTRICLMQKIWIILVSSINYIGTITIFWLSVVHTVIFFFFGLEFVWCKKSELFWFLRFDRFWNIGGLATPDAGRDDIFFWKNNLAFSKAQYKHWIFTIAKNTWWVIFYRSTLVNLPEFGVPKFV